jgi:hypothetical protein
MRHTTISAKFWSLLLTGGVAVTLAAQPATVLAQEGDEDANEPAFPKQFWNYLQKVDYQENWSRWPGQEQEFSEGRSPHGALLKIYVNKKAAENLDDPPAKAVIVKENYNENEELMAITPMYRVGKDYDPEHNDWYWAKYKPDGTLFKKDGAGISGRVEACIKCHESAGGEDYIFTND